MNTYSSEEINTLIEPYSKQQRDMLLDFFWNTASAIVLNKNLWNNNEVWERERDYDDVLKMVKEKQFLEVGSILDQIPWESTAKNRIELVKKARKSVA